MNFNGFDSNTSSVIDIISSSVVTNVQSGDIKTDSFQMGANTLQYKLPTNTPSNGQVMSDSNGDLQLEWVTPSSSQISSATQTAYTSTATNKKLLTVNSADSKITDAYAIDDTVNTATNLYTASKINTLLGGISTTLSSATQTAYTSTATNKKLLTVNSADSKLTDAYAIDDTINTATNLYTASKINTLLGDKVNSSLLGANNGVAQLDGTGKLPASQLPISAVEHKGVYDATTTLPAAPSSGDMYVVSVGNPSHGVLGDVAIGDFIIYNGNTSSWSLIPNTPFNTGSLAGNVPLNDNALVNGNTVEINNGKLKSVPKNSAWNLNYELVLPQTDNSQTKLMTADKLNDMVTSNGYLWSSSKIDSTFLRSTIPRLDNLTTIANNPKIQNKNTAGTILDIGFSNYAFYGSTIITTSVVSGTSIYLSLWDLSVPLRPAWVSSINLTIDAAVINGVNRILAINNRYICVVFRPFSGSPSNFKIIDWNNRANMNVIFTSALTAGTINNQTLGYTPPHFNLNAQTIDVVVKGSYLYALRGSSVVNKSMFIEIYYFNATSFTLISVSAQPVLNSAQWQTFSYTSTAVGSMTVHGNYILICHQSDGQSPTQPIFIDITSPILPKIFAAGNWYTLCEGMNGSGTANFHNGGTSNLVALVINRTQNNGTIQIFDISNMLNPVLISSAPQSATVSYNAAYINSQYVIVQRFDGASKLTQYNLSNFSFVSEITLSSLSPRTLNIQAVAEPFFGEGLFLPSAVSGATNEIIQYSMRDTVNYSALRMGNCSFDNAISENFVVSRDLKTNNVYSNAISCYNVEVDGVIHTDSIETISITTANSSSDVTMKNFSNTATATVANDGNISMLVDTNLNRAFQIRNSSNASIFIINSSEINCTSLRLLSHTLKSPTTSHLKMQNNTDTANVQITDNGSIISKINTDASELFRVQNSSSVNLFTINATDINCTSLNLLSNTLKSSSGSSLIIGNNQLSNKITFNDNTGVMQVDSNSISLLPTGDYTHKINTTGAKKITYTNSADATIAEISTSGITCNNISALSTSNLKLQNNGDTSNIVINNNGNITNTVASSFSINGITQDFKASAYANLFFQSSTPGTGDPDYNITVGTNDKIILGYTAPSTGSLSFASSGINRNITLTFGPGGKFQVDIAGRYRVTQSLLCIRRDGTTVTFNMHVVANLDTTSQATIQSGYNASAIASTAQYVYLNGNTYEGLSNVSFITCAANDTLTFGLNYVAGGNGHGIDIAQANMMVERIIDNV